MTLRVSLIIDGAWQGAKAALAGTSAGIKQVEQDAKKLPAVNPFATIDNGAKQAVTSLGSTRMTFKALAREAALVGGPMAGMIGQVGTLAIGTGRLGGAITVGVIGIAALVATVYKAVTAFSELEQHQVKVANTLAATKNASGQTVAGLEAMTRELSASGTQSVADIREAQVALLRYKSIGGDAFGSVLKIARDVAATGIAPLKDATITLAKAFDDPAQAAEHFKDIGASLSVQQQRLAKDLMATGDKLGAQRVLAAALSTQFAGADARAADTLAGAWGKLSKSGGGFFEQLGKDIADAWRLKDVMEGLASAAERVNAARAKAPSMGNPFTLPFRMGFGLGTNIGETVVPPPAPKAKGAPAFDEGGFVAFGKQAAKETADAKAAAEAEAARKKRIDEVVDAFEAEARSAGLSGTALKIYNEQVKAGVLTEEQLKNGLLGTSDAARQVASAVNEVAAKGFMRQVADQFIAQNSALRAQAATAGMALGPAEAYRKEQELLARAEAEHTKLGAADRAELKAKATAYGALTDAAARMKLQSDLTFERKSLFLSEEDVAIATRLRDLYGNDIPAALASTEAAQMRVNSAFKGLKEGGTELTSSLFRDLRTELQNGATGFDALRKAGSNALGTLADKLSDMASKQLWNAAFGGKSGGGLISLLSAAFGGSASVADASFGGFSMAGTNAAAVKFDGGGYTGNLSRYDIAGVVHGREFVMDADTTARHLPLLQALHEGRLPGYAEGGYVGVMPPLSSASRSGGVGAPVAIHQGDVHITVQGSADTKTVERIGEVVREHMDHFSRRELPTLVHHALADPRAR
jgi:Prophage tail length tape measure protein